MILVYIAIAAGTRIMVDMLFDVFFYICSLNHIRLPEPDWKLWVIKFFITVAIIAPIFTVLP